MNIRETFKNLTSRNYKAYLLFLILTLILWFAIQLTKSYSFQNELSIQLSNIPKHIVLDSSEQNLNVNLKSNGFKLWKYNMSSDKFTIDFNDFAVDSFQLKMGASQLKKIIANTYDFNSEDITLDKLLLTFEFKRKETQIVPVKSYLKFRFASGYNTIDTLKLSPDSVVISGSKQDLEKINSIKTQQVELKNVDDTLRGEIPLVKPNSNVEISYDKVEYYLPVKKFSENALMIDIEAINIPDSLELNIFPNEAKVSFLVALQSFENVSSTDFKVVCDYDKRYQKDGIMIPKLVKYPDNILNPKLHIRKVDYLVKQKQ